MGGAMTASPGSRRWHLPGVRVGPVSAQRIRLLNDHLTGAALVTVAVLAGVLLVLPTLVVILASFTSTSYLSFPPAGLSLRWYARLLPSEALFGVALLHLLIV